MSYNKPLLSGGAASGCSKQHKYYTTVQRVSFVLPINLFLISIVPGCENSLLTYTIYPSVILHPTFEKPKKFKFGKVDNFRRVQFSF
jgi:hypothetical protein